MAHQNNWFRDQRENDKQAPVSPIFKEAGFSLEQFTHLNFHLNREQFALRALMSISWPPRKSVSGLIENFVVALAMKMTKLDRFTA